MAKSLVSEFTPSETAQIQALIKQSLAEGNTLNHQMAEDQQRIERLKEETRQIAAEARRNLEPLHEEVALLKMDRTSSSPASAGLE